jgi:hypothetical protein
MLRCRVGRVDGSQATALTQLPANDMNVDAFVAWWTARGFSVAEAVALMGAHGLIDSQGCYRYVSRVFTARVLHSSLPQHTICLVGKNSGACVGIETQERHGVMTGCHHWVAAQHWQLPLWQSVVAV